MTMQIANEGRGGIDYTWIHSVSTLGKHLRKLGSILTSLRILKCRCSANICTLGTVVFGLSIVPDCNAQNNRYMKHHRVKLLD
jgi:hypothetical protein